LVATVLNSWYGTADTVTWLQQLGRDTLGRSLNAYEVNSWMANMQHGDSRGSVVTAFMNCAEYWRLDSVRWVRELGQETLQRSLNDYEVGSWVSYLLAGGTRESTVSAFVQCEEYMRLLPSH
jgi:hypothetical protein